MKPRKDLRLHSLTEGVGRWNIPLVVEGIRGRTIMDSGYVFAPYIPLIEEPEEFRPRRGVASRYARKIVNNDFYGSISISDLPDATEE